MISQGYKKKQVSGLADLSCLAPPTIQISNKLLEDLKKLHDLAQLIPVEKYDFNKFATGSKAKSCRDLYSHTNLKPTTRANSPISPLETMGREIEENKVSNNRKGKGNKEVK